MRHRHANRTPDDCPRASDNDALRASAISVSISHLSGPKFDNFENFS